MLTKKQFDILDYLIENDSKKSQRDISINTKLSLGTVNKILKELTDLGYINNNIIMQGSVIYGGTVFKNKESLLFLKNEDIAFL